MSFTCIAIDDEPLALELVEEYVAAFPRLQLAHTFDDAISTAEFLRVNPVDILFVDINMPDITGIELIKSLDYKPAVIFTTAYKKFAFEGFEVEAVDYLLKPLNFDRFSRAVNKAITQIEQKRNNNNAKEENLFVRSEYRLIKINIQDIEFIESLEDYIKIHLTNEKPILTLMPLKTVLEKLPQDKFKRIHRSYVVALNKVRSVLNRKVLLLSSTELPVSDKYAGFVDEWKKG
ncbi:LytTR family DNA-binding domain-containing protein [Danxiaibacter flavus]|uniref:LytTR family DNA-binding domain-containing protein n=1 Tax=Danxiaibacter flavus TaxID=3049108 RepID=A0ABV3ZH91_9BACT|nr:LytTR family DNA-binding domain-containing protein [Chitinophagaceae bacterium DXS]